MIPADEAAAAFPTALSAYPAAGGRSLLDILTERIDVEPFNAIATAIFFIAVIHTFAAARFTVLAHQVQHRRDEEVRRAGGVPRPSVLAEGLHFLGEVEVIFGLWAVVLMFAITLFEGWETAKHYLNSTVNYTEPLFVIVIMTIASTRPIVAFAEGALRRVAQAGKSTPAAWWITILTIGPVLGSFITEPAAMTICALLLARRFFDLQPSKRLKYATLGLLFVNVSIGGTLTNFAAPPVLMVARTWGWDTSFMFMQFGLRAVASIIVATLTYYVIFRSELKALTSRAPVADIDRPLEDDNGVAAPLLPVPAWVTVVHLGFMGWTVFNAHYPALFLGGFLIFLGFAGATAVYQSRIDLKGPLLVGFFLAGLVIHGGLQAWWIAPVLGGLTETPLFASATLLTAFNDNALITYLASLVPNLDDRLKMAIMEGAVTGGGLTVIANAPNPAGQALLSRFFGGAVQPVWLLLGAIIPTLVAVAAFRLV